MKMFDMLHNIKLVQILKKENLFNLFLGSIDMFLLLVTFQISFNIMYPGREPLFFLNRPHLILFLYMVPSWILVLHVCNLAQIPRTSRYSRLLLGYVLFTVLNVIILYVFYFIFLFNAISHTFIIVFALIGLVLLYSTRILEYKILKKYRASGYNYVNIILVADSTSESFIKDLLLRKEWGYRILLIFSDSLTLKKRFGKKIKILPEKSITTLKNLLEIDVVDEVLYLKKAVNAIGIRESIRSCEEIGVVFRLRIERSPFLLTNARTSKIGNTSFLTFVNIPTNSIGLTLKTTMDIYLSFILLIILSPLMLIISLSILISSPGPILFRQARVGLRGRQFYIYKFRTMVINAEELKKQLEAQNEMDGPVFKIEHDPRITPVGKFLRKTGLDELPQLFNVLKGEMSLIGPRPPLQSETLQYKRWQLRRLSVKPGITCSWQIIPNRNNVKFDHWMKMDLAYIDNWSPRLDFMLLLKTISTILRGSGK